MDKLLDPGFKLHKTCSQLSIHMLLQLAESVILPLQPEEIVREVEKALGKMEKNNVTKTLVDNGAGTAYTSMKQSFQKFKLSVDGWAEKKVTLENSYEITDFPSQRIFNDQIMLLERTFLLPQGLPGRHNYRHALFSPAKFDSYAGAAFPGLQDLLHGAETLDGEKKRSRFKEIRKHLSDLMIVFHQASSWLSQNMEL